MIMTADMRFANKHKLITAVLPKGIAANVLSSLKEEKDIITANINNARGSGKLTPLKYRGLGEQTEKEILTVVVEARNSDEIFDYLYEKAEVNRPHGGLMFVHKLGRSTEYTIPNIEEED